MAASETIVAQVTPPGFSGVAVLRVSGPLVAHIAEQILGYLPPPRQADYTAFKAIDKQTIDLGIALYFKKPHSFTGEDVLELQGHGGPVVIDELLQHALQCGARLAKPGEFSEQAFLNDKLDLAQAEAIADLINSASSAAARCAIRSLQGQFSEKIHALVQQLIHLRTFVEAAIDFPEEDIDFLEKGHIGQHIQNLQQQLNSIMQTARQGQILQEGMRVVIVGEPNVGKSSLLNALSGREVAIVTDIPGTTRDVLQQHILIDGMPVHIIDTAGLRQSSDTVELEGMRRAKQYIQQADHLLLMTDERSLKEWHLADVWPSHLADMPQHIPMTIVHNKIDLYQQPAQLISAQQTHVFISAKTEEGINLLRQHLKHCIGLETHTEGQFLARRRHLTALQHALTALQKADEQLRIYRALELVAEELRLAQQALASITGEFSSDDLLGEIFSSFCIGK